MHASKPSTLGLDLRKIGRALASLVIGLVAAHCLGLISTYVLGHDSVKGLVPLFNMDLRYNVPWFVSSALFMVGSAGFVLLGRLDPLADGPGKHWIVLAVVFLYLAVDNAIGIHERATGPVRQMLNTSDFLYFAWIIPYGIATGLLAVYILPRLLALPKRIRSLFLLAATVYLLGAIGLGGLEGRYGQAYEALPASERAAYADMLAYDLLETVKDTLELTGLAILVYAQAELLNLAGRKVGLICRQV